MSGVRPECTSGHARGTSVEQMTRKQIIPPQNPAMGVAARKTQTMNPKPKLTKAALNASGPCA